MKKYIKKLSKFLGVKESLRNVTYKGTGFAVRNKNISFMQDADFVDAWNYSLSRNKEGWKNNVPDFRWQAHLACFAAKHGLTLEGDFVEFGVHTALLSSTICKYLNFEKENKKFYLFDTYEGIPISKNMTNSEIKIAEHHNNHTYFDCYHLVKETFSKYENVEMVKGMLPKSLEDVEIKKIAYVSIDLNNAQYEKDVIESIWDKITPSAMIVIDDYAYKGHEDQYAMWNAFAQSKSKMIYTVPTGQGILIK